MAHVNTSYVDVEKDMIMTLFGKLIMWLTSVIKVLGELRGQSFSSPFMLSVR